ncbi:MULTISPECIES: lipoprotein [Colwelliaceae]|nr:MULTISPECIES: lipoprotein [Colwelliaceae]
MCKQISIILVCIVSLTAITGCGIKGPLYQTPSENVEPNPPEKTEMSQQ